MQKKFGIKKSGTITQEFNTLQRDIAMEWNGFIFICEMSVCCVVIKFLFFLKYNSRFIYKYHNVESFSNQFIQLEAWNRLIKKCE